MYMTFKWATHSLIANAHNRPHAGFAEHYEETEAEYTLVAQLELPRGDFSTVNGRYCAKELNLFIKDD